MNVCLLCGQIFEMEDKHMYGKVAFWKTNRGATTSRFEALVRIFAKLHCISKEMNLSYSLGRFFCQLWTEVPTLSKQEIKHGSRIRSVTVNLVVRLTANWQTHATHHGWFGTRAWEPRAYLLSGPLVCQQCNTARWMFYICTQPIMTRVPQ